MVKNKKISGILIPAGCLIGLGIRQWYGRPDAGVLIGLGCGFLGYFIAEAVIKKK